ncbi:MAG TPA: epoxide hydrolase [Candidatus Binatia bacterium]|nr:epoxide hydrolase [Candidatus Binatia bacterium]
MDSKSHAPGAADVPTPYTVAIPEEILDDLRERLERTRWPDEVDGAGWEYGASLAYMKDLVAYWRAGFDWRAQERAINAFSHFRARVAGTGIHFIHERGRGPAPMPLVITHGWPSSFCEMLPLIPLLADPGAHGGDPADAFDVVVPSVPGFGFSDRPTERGMTRSRVAELWVRLMSALGYQRFAAHGNDIGAVITGWMALDHPERLIGIHTMMPGFPGPDFGPGTPPMSEAERAFAARQDRWGREEGGYNLIQETRPQTLAYGLHDSPAGLAAWIVEKWRAWTDPDGDLDRHFTRDTLLTNVTIYWVTETANASGRSYYERARDPRRIAPDARIAVPTGVALSTEAVQRVPREWAERRYVDIRRWTEFDRGGHFMAAEEPALLAEEIRAFFRPLRDAAGPRASPAG